VKQTIYYISGSLFLVIMMGMIITSENGFLDMVKMRSMLKAIETTSSQVSMENTSLYRKINRLKSDPDYIENIARTEMGMVAEDDVVILFDDTDTD